MTDVDVVHTDVTASATATATATADDLFGGDAGAGVGIRGSADAFGAASGSTGDDTSADGTTKPKPGIGNGGDTGKYKWQQSLEEVTVTVPFPSGTRARDLVVEYTTSHLRFGLKGAELIVDADLPKRIKTSECMWMLDDGTLTIVLFKEKGNEWWSQIAVGEPEIDIKQVEPEPSKLSDLDDEARQMTEKLMFDDRQRKLGLPTSQEMEQADLIKKFKEMHPEYAHAAPM